VAASKQAAAAAGLTIGADNASESGVVIGNCVAGLLSICNQLDVMKKHGPRRVSPILAPTMIPDSASVQVSLTLGTKGINYAPSSACSSSTDAIGHSYEIIRRGDARIMFAGGAEAPIIPLVMASFINIRALSSRNDDPKGACRPFDGKRDGFVLGEGAAIMVLEEAGFAISRGAPILAEVIGYGNTSDAYHLTQPSPDGARAAEAIRLALRSAGIGPDEIDYINAHGTSTLLNDRTETTVIKTVFGDKAKKVPMSASKSMIGHMIGAAGGIEAVITVLAMQHGILPPTINQEYPDPECDLDYVPNVARKATVNTAMANSFGFGGHNSVLIFRKFQP
jgi:3-oxoacyl-[acyl-carrier-protein] synthase II